MADPFVLGAVRFCQNPKFFLFLESKQCAPVTDKESAADSLRQLCGITSRAELATNSRARDAYKTLIGEFNQFMKGGRA
ncbi:hypothetical protein [Enterobacter ludwigii]|uniref:hypothetical protein n=1 Tax=Enterobacter ludwigii TaxID=299767 RepID=UPI0030767DA3